MHLIGLGRYCTMQQVYLVGRSHIALIILYYASSRKDRSSGAKVTVLESNASVPYCVSSILI